MFITIKPKNSKTTPSVIAPSPTSSANASLISVSSTSTTDNVSTEIVTVAGNTNSIDYIGSKRETPKQGEVKKEIINLKTQDFEIAREIGNCVEYQLKE